MLIMTTDPSGYGMSGGGDGDACLEVGVGGSPLSWHELPKAPTA